MAKKLCVIGLDCVTPQLLYGEWLDEQAIITPEGRPGKVHGPPECLDRLFLASHALGRVRQAGEILQGSLADTLRSLEARTCKTPLQCQFWMSSHEIGQADADGHQGLLGRLLCRSPNQLQIGQVFVEEDFFVPK